ncbi:MAG: helix-turn-helix domain-containing protein, partial [Dehalococcoidia bacterium]
MSRKRTAPQQLRAQRTRRDLLTAARRAFATAGYEGATIDDIAEAAGCSKGAYYFHFATKEEALLAMIDDWTRERTR